MATKHKAPTQVTLHHAEKSAFAQWVESNWRMGAAVAVAIAATILASQVLRQRDKASTSAEWDRLRTAMQSGDAGTLLAAAPDLPPTQAAWAKMAAATLHVQAAEYDAALAALEGMPDGTLFSLLPMPAGTGPRRSGVEAARALIAGQRDLERSLAAKLENPAPPADAPRVKLDTSLGEITIVLYADRAPLHVENFLARVDEGYYGDLKFHRVEKGIVIQTGDPNTRSGDPATWGQGGPEERVEPEGDNGLIHVPYAVGMARSGNDPKSSGSQFYVTLSRQHRWDRDYTVFGAVDDPASREVVDRIGEVPVEGNRPTDPPVLRSVTRL